MLKNIALSLSFGVLFHGGHCVSLAHARGVSLPDPSLARPKPVAMLAALPPNSAYISQAERNQWTITCDSEQSSYYGCKKAVDGGASSYWQSTSDSSTHNITIDLKSLKNVNAISVTPRGGVSDGRIAGHKVFLSRDGVNWGEPAAFGTWFHDADDKFAPFEPQQAQYVRLQALSVHGKAGTRYATAAEINVWTVSQYKPTPPSLGRWGPTLDFPIVPVGVWVDPLSGNLISFSSYAHDRFDLRATTNTTLTTVWDRRTNSLTQRRISKTHHDMFCPGMSFDVNGRMIISGGETSQKTSVYNPSTGDWTAEGEMNIARGYQGSVTTSDGRIFVIGGSWSPDGGAPNWSRMGGRTGELFDPVKNQWTLLKGADADKIETTDDWQGEYREDNHAWLMGWKNGTIFHAGPSKNMHWIETSGDGAIKDAGLRGSDDHAMCGVAVMYDAVKGKILTAGGAPQYQYWDNTLDPWVVKGKASSKNAFVITLGDSNSNVEVKSAGGGMKFNRIFHHGVVLPSGEVFVSGGQALGMPFTDQTGQLNPEMYNPDTDSWTTMAPNSIVRTYHSVGLLLPDATVLIGGGGLCGECTLNHYDAQIYTPPYLLTSSGSLAARPTIKSTSAASVRPGATFTFVADSAIKSASLIRYGGSTHSLNNDQRRIPLELKQTSRGGYEYSVTIPSDGGVAIPGYWMLFALNAQGVPSEAKNVQIQIAGNSSSLPPPPSYQSSTLSSSKLPSPTSSSSSAGSSSSSRPTPPSYQSPSPSPPPSTTSRPSPPSYQSPSPPAYQAPSSTSTSRPSPPRYGGY